MLGWRGPSLTPRRRLGSASNAACVAASSRVLQRATFSDSACAVTTYGDDGRRVITKPLLGRAAGAGSSKPRALRCERRRRYSKTCSLAGRANTECKRALAVAGARWSVLAGGTNGGDCAGRGAPIDALRDIMGSPGGRPYSCNKVSLAYS